MKIVLFYHSLVSDWNHGNAHFLRGVVGELLARGHETVVYEPADGWSARNMVTEHGEAPLREFETVYPGLRSTRYELAALDLDHALDGADLVIVHEWSDHELVRRVGEHRARAGGAGYRLFFHDTHHRAVSAPEQMRGYDLSNYDGVLAYGNVLREIYTGWGHRAWTWHEAADTRVFYPLPHGEMAGDLVWIGNWGDDERSAELREFLIDPIAALGLRARVYGVRYPEAAQALLRDAGVEYGGWLPNYRAPAVFAQYRVTVHVPRRPYVEALPGIPTIRPFEALACGIPLVSSPWDDVEGLFTPGEDFLVARNGQEMRKHLSALLADKQMAREIAERGLRTIRARHTCAHRVDELMNIHREICA